MAKDTSDHITFFLSIPTENAGYLGEFRHWDNLKMGIEGQLIWVKDLTFSQMESVAVKSLLSKRIYTLHEGKLYPKDSLLPERNAPALLWTPIQRGISLEMPELNHNFFTLNEKITLNIIPSEAEREPFAMLLPLQMLVQACPKIPEMRLSRLQWVKVGESHALVLGTPLLPLQGEVFWQNHNFLIPTGHDFDLYAFTASLDRLINPDGRNWVVWDAESAYFLVKKSNFTPLSLASVRLTYENRADGL